jgi:crotonobetainyl-CoA:carnitine CoA-transferase CaiB-like acyl-CoA transferase
MKPRTEAAFREKLAAAEKRRTRRSKADLEALLAESDETNGRLRELLSRPLYSYTTQFDELNRTRAERDGLREALAAVLGFISGDEHTRDGGRTPLAVASTPAARAAVQAARAVARGSRPNG